MYCKHCAAELFDGMTECPKCWTPINENDKLKYVNNDTENQTEPEIEKEEKTDLKEIFLKENAAEEKAKSEIIEDEKNTKPKGIIIAVVAVVVAIAILIVTVVIPKTKDADSGSNNEISAEGTSFSEYNSVGVDENEVILEITEPAEENPESKIEDEKSTTKSTTTKIDPDKLFRPEKKYFCDQYSAYVFCTDTDIQDYVKMRFGPSKYDYNVVSKINNYTKIVVESTSVNGWTLCQCYDYEGWIRSDFIFKGAPPCNDNIR